MFQKSPWNNSLTYLQEKAVLLFLIFSLLFSSTSFGESLDQKLYDTIHCDWKSPFLDNVMPRITNLGDDATGVLFTVTLIAFGDEKGRDSGILTAVALTGSSLIVLGMKSAINRNRPEDPEGTTKRSNSSFPSGHASGAFSVATVIGGRYSKARIPAFTLASLIGYSRIYLGKHYPSDVLGGAVLGIASGIVVLQFEEKILNLF